MTDNPQDAGIPGADDHTRIKICGITRVADGVEAIALGVDFIGMIFYPPSPRYIEPERAGRVVAELRDRTSRMGRRMPRVIGVFVDESPEKIAEVRRIAGLDGAQFSGDEPPEVVGAVRPVRFRGLSLETIDRLGRYETEAYLCDTHAPDVKGGTGRAYDYDALAPHMKTHRLIVAGGLTSETVGGVVERLRPWGVDVSSAVETEPGRKDVDKMRAFVEAVRRADA